MLNLYSALLSKDRFFFKKKLIQLKFKFLFTMRSHGNYFFCASEKKLMKPTGGIQTGKLDGAKSEVVSKVPLLIKKNKPLGKKSHNYASHARRECKK